MKNYVCDRYKVDPEKIIRPFWPDTDYESETYTEDSVVVDNPPFSILAKIKEFYIEHGVKFFLFCPELTALCSRWTLSLCHIIANTNIVYENGAIVKTAFVTNLESDCVMRTDPELGKSINAVSRALKRKKKKTLPKYDYPNEVVTSALFGRYAKYGIDIKIKPEDCMVIRELDAQKERGKSIFGNGLLLSERAAAERAAAERAAAERAAAERAAAERAAAERAAAEHWRLSERERALVRKLGKK